MKKHFFVIQKISFNYPEKARGYVDKVRILFFFLVFCLCKKVEKERAFVIRAPHPSMERWPAESSVSHFRIRDQHRQQHSPQQHHTSFNRRRNNIFKRAKMKSLYDDKSTFLRRYISSACNRIQVIRSFLLIVYVGGFLLSSLQHL